MTHTNQLILTSPGDLLGRFIRPGHWIQLLATALSPLPAADVETVTARRSGLCAITRVCEAREEALLLWLGLV